MHSKGWIRLHRKIHECWLWECEEPFDKRSAWIDLLLLANHSDKKILFNGELIIVTRGQYLTSIRKLAERWRWTRNRVDKFLKLLESDNMLMRKSDNSKTLIFIEKYEVYQAFDDNTQPPTEPPSNPRIEPPLEQGGVPQQCHDMSHPQSTNNNDNNVNNDKQYIKNEREYNAPSFDAERAWNDTLDKYPKKSAAVMAKQRWMEILVDTPEPNRKNVAVLIFNAIKLYLLDYEKNNPDDKDFRYIPKLHTWFEQDCGYWITKAEVWQKEANGDA